MKRCLILLIGCLITLFSRGQSMSLEEYLSAVRRYHPVARQALLDVSIAKANVTAARGAFDPVIQNDIARKEFGGLLYYDHQTTELKVPTWYGVDLVTGIESLSGNRTSTPDTKGNTSYIGFRVPVGNGLLMDKRRAALQQAKIFESLSVQDQRTTLNNLLFDAAQAYWNWWLYYEVQRLFTQAITNAEQRFQLVKTAFRLGDRPAIDTVEALAQLQSFQIRRAEIALEIVNAQLETSVFLWQQQGEPYTLPAAVVPQQPVIAPEVLRLDDLLARLPQHPELQGYRFQLAGLQVDRRLKAQALLPTIYLKYNQLTRSHHVEKAVTSPWLENNYRYGLDVKIPLRFSEGRGNLKAAKLKIEQTELKRINKVLALQTKVRQYHNEWQALQQQQVLQQQAITSYTILQRGEEVRFNNGEGSLFLINTREQKTLEARQKLLEIQSKTAKAVAATLWAAGLLGS